MNLVSNDVRRFDEAMPFWVFLWAGPLELAMVALMISLELGAAAAFAGIAALLALIPLQVGSICYYHRTSLLNASHRLHVTAGASPASV